MFLYLQQVGERQKKMCDSVDKKEIEESIDRAALEDPELLAMYLQFLHNLEGGTNHGS